MRRVSLHQLKRPQAWVHLATRICVVDGHRVRQQELHFITAGGGRQATFTVAKRGDAKSQSLPDEMHEANSKRCSLRIPFHCDRTSRRYYHYFSKTKSQIFTNSTAVGRRLSAIAMAPARTAPRATWLIWIQKVGKHKKQNRACR